MSLLSRVFSMLTHGVANIVALKVCVECARDSDEVVGEERFGDYACCERCRRPKTSKDAAILIIES